MATGQRAHEILADAEKALAALASEAAKDHDYDAANCLIELAREMGSLATKSRLRLEPPVVEMAPTSAPAAGPVAAAPSRPERRGEPRKSDYPRFFREGDNLIKIG